MATGWRLFPPSMDSFEFGGGQLAGGDGLFAGTVPIQMTRGPTTKHAVVAGLHARAGGGCTRREAQLEQFANRGGSRWHSIPKSEVVNDQQFFWRKHDLQSLAPEIVHGGLPKKSIF
jgi:hypothetical protein